MDGAAPTGEGSGASYTVSVLTVDFCDRQPGASGAVWTFHRMQCSTAARSVTRHLHRSASIPTSAPQLFERCTPGTAAWRRSSSAAASRSPPSSWLPAGAAFQKVLDCSGVRIGAVLSDFFGANGRRVLDGLVSRLDREVIIASLSGHVRLKVDQLGDALRLELRETDRILLTDLLDEHDTLTRRVSQFDRYIDQALASHAEACRLLETIPGIDHTSACVILIETGPDVAVFGAARRPPPRRLGKPLSRQQRECRQTPIRTRTARKQDAAHGARRVRACCRSDAQLPVPGLPQGVDSASGTRAAATCVWSTAARHGIAGHLPPAPPRSA